MNRIAAYLLGPELVWIVMLALTGIIISLHQPLPVNDHDKLLNFGWFLPVLGVLLAFVPFYWAPGSHWWWLTRIGLASMVGILVVVGILCDAARYNDSRDSGIGTAYMLFVGLGIMALIGMGLVVTVGFIARWPFPTVFKWILIVSGVLAFFIGAISWLASLGTSKTP
jgi:hypothetical protein